MKRYKESLLQAITDSAQDAIIVMGADGRIAFWNPAAERILQYTEEEVIGSLLVELLVVEELRDVYIERINNFIKNGEGPSIGKTTDQKTKRKDGKIIDIQVSLSRIKLGEMWGSVGIVRDVTERRKAQEALWESEQRFRKLSITEPLTGLYNRWHYKFELSREVDRAKRYFQPLSVIIFDIDDFKLFNNEYGHDAGDEVLELIGQVVKSNTRANDIPCRIGGDEFFIILPMTEQEVAHDVAERIWEEIQSTKLSFTQKTITITSGVIQCQPDESIKDLFVRVDQAMINAKRDGKNRISVA